jgi:hypothetical protein
VITKRATRNRPIPEIEPSESSTEAIIAAISRANTNPTSIAYEKARRNGPASGYWNTIRSGVVSRTVVSSGSGNGGRGRGHSRSPSMLEPGPTSLDSRRPSPVASFSMVAC